MSRLVSTSLDRNPATSMPSISPNVPSSNDPNAIGYADSPNLQYYRKNSTRFIDMLPPNPRPQQILEPSDTKMYPKYTQNRYERGQKYLVSSKNQNMIGIVDGGLDNSNWVRGNQFAVDYDYKDIWGKPQHELKPLEKQPPTIANVVPSQYYPYTTMFDRNNRKFKTYPEQNQMFAGLFPFYTVADQTTDFTDRVPGEKPQDLPIRENFSASPSGSSMGSTPVPNRAGVYLFLSVLLAVLLFIALLFLRKRK